VRFDLDCAACFVRQAAEVTARFGASDEIAARVMEAVRDELARFPRTLAPPEMGGILHAIVRRELALADPYAEIKARDDARAAVILPEAWLLVERSADPFSAAARAAIAGNLIDFGVPAGDTDADPLALIQGALSRALPAEAEAAVASLAERARTARRILYLADNAGEIALDRLLVERLPRGAVTVAVRSTPAINDALLADAAAVGMTEVADVIESGSGIPGTLLETATPEFRARFAAADLVIAKGQGNFETLSDVDAPIAFLLIAKCTVVARALGRAVGDFAIVVR
jgi:damage-control phosphatase, subfamily I